MVATVIGYHICTSMVYSQHDVVGLERKKKLNKNALKQSNAEFTQTLNFTIWFHNLKEISNTVRVFTSQFTST